MDESRAAPASPRVFISYSHDSEDHRRRVGELAEQLRADKVDVRIDLDEEPPQGWPSWSEEQFRKAEWVLAICTETYFRRFHREEKDGTGRGVIYEASLMRNEIYLAGSRNQRILPVLFDAADANHVPGTFQDVTRYDLSSDDGYERLLGRLQGRNEPLPERIRPKRPRRVRKRKLVGAVLGVVITLAMLIFLASRAESEPSVILRPPLLALRALDSGGRLCVWQVENGHRTVLARMEDDSGSLQIGSPRDIEEDLVEEWRTKLVQELREEGRGDLGPETIALAEEILEDWKNPHRLATTRDLVSGMQLVAEVHTMKGTVVAATGPFTLGAGPLHDQEMDPVGDDVEASDDCDLPSDVELGAE